MNRIRVNEIMQFDRVKCGVRRRRREKGEVNEEVKNKGNAGRLL